MASRYEVYLSPHALRDLEAIQDPDAIRIEAACERLENQPRPRGAAKLEEDTFRLRIGQYRVIYFVDDKEMVIVITHIRRRSETTYSNL